MGKAKQAKITETLSTESSGGDVPTQLNNQQKEILSEALKIPEPPTYQEIMPPSPIGEGEEYQPEIDEPPTWTSMLNMAAENYAKLNEENKEVDNGDGLAVPPTEDEIKPLVMAAFINDLIKKTEPVDVFPQILDGESYIDIISSAPKTASHYARRNISSLKDKVAAVVSKQSYVDAVNIEERGVFKCHPDKPIKN